MFKIPEFLFKKPMFQIKIRIRELHDHDVIRLTSDQINCLQQFQDILINKAFNLKFQLDFETSQYGGFIVLLNDSFEIDFSRSDPIGFKKDNLSFLAGNPNRGIYKMIKLNTELSPMSEFPNKDYGNYMEYHQIKNGFVTKVVEQPLVQVERIDRSLNFISNEFKKNKIDRSKYETYFIAEHLVYLPFNLDEFNKLRLVPSILYRINSICNAKLLKKSIESSGDWESYSQDDSCQWETSIKYNNLKQYESVDDCPPASEVDCESDTCDGDRRLDEDINFEETIVTDQWDQQRCGDNDEADEDDCDELDKAAEFPEIFSKLSLSSVPQFQLSETQTSDQVRPNVFEILQCLTLRYVNDSFDLERYEVLGDTFLKLSISLYIYTRFNKTNEGNLTFLKSQRVSNRYLFKLASKKRLDELVNACVFNPKTSWLAPNMGQNINNLISDKSLADVVEALIGLYLIKCGTIGAQKLMNWLEFIVSSQLGIVDFTESYELPNPLVVEIAEQERLQFEVALRRRFESFENKIGYKFNNIFYLQQAFTHPSYTLNRHTCSFQRLEFVGDAVLDLLVTQYLFHVNKEYSPGMLHFECQLKQSNSV
jgi:dsRNA-specific ribonuclease